MTGPETEETGRTVREELQLAYAEVQAMSYRDYLEMLVDIAKDPPETGALLGFVVNASMAALFTWLALTVFDGIVALACGAIALWSAWAIVKWVIGL